MKTIFTRGKIFLEVKGRNNKVMLVDLDKIDCIWKEEDVTEPFTTIVMNGKAYGIIEHYDEVYCFLSIYSELKETIMKWTKKPPKVKGYYWNRGYTTTPIIVEIFHDEVNKKMSALDGDRVFEINESEYEWCGPLREPKI